MTTSSLLPHLIDELVKSFNVDRETATAQATIEDLGLDSLALLELITRYEDEYDVELMEVAEGQLGTTSTLADICAVLEKVLPGAHPAAQRAGGLV
ncbi:acyl carrier protein [Streptomyces sp. NPDC017940]|uniref:acyl carrier protein n=1 Tax=Streptomyces sp. NPDC017940 TaxID=3365017 RepID=UPI00379C0CD6